LNILELIRPERLSTRSPAVGTQVWSNVLSLINKETPDFEPLNLHTYVDFHQSSTLLVVKEDIHPMTYISGLANMASKECNDKTLFGIHTPVVDGVSSVGWVSMMNWRRLAFWRKSLVLFNGTSSDFVDMDFQDSLRRKKAFRFSTLPLPIFSRIHGVPIGVTTNEQGEPTGLVLSDYLSSTPFRAATAPYTHFAFDEIPALHSPRDVGIVYATPEKSHFNGHISYNTMNHSFHIRCNRFIPKKKGNPQLLVT
jgi:hypothetical protein